MGKTDGVICSTVNSTSAGMSDRAAPMRFQAICSARRTSVPGARSMDTSHPPRMVLERTRATPMTELTASSSGRVTWTSMLTTARPGFLATTAMRGNVTSG
jgi:hypothetical protein